MNILDNNMIEVLDKIFRGFKRDVSIKFFGTGQGAQARFSDETKNLVEGVANISSRINLDSFNFDTDKEALNAFGIKRAPALVVMDGTDYGIRFYGAPGGHEFNSFIESLKLIASREDMLMPKTREFLDNLNTDIHLQVFVNPNCVKCPKMVTTAHRMAFYSPMVNSDMIEASNFAELAQKYGIMGVPHTIINETDSLSGLVLEDKIVEKLQAHIQSTHIQSTHIQSN
jgi:glutaredoxin-like protein